MEFFQLVEALRTRAGLYVGRVTYESLCSFVGGFDLARDGAPLAGFREWLIVRARRGDNLHWAGLVRILAVPSAGPQELSAEQDQVCCQALLSLLTEYLAYRQAVGITKVHYDYARWLLRHRWYTGSLRKNRPGGTG